ncbi:hypothetical protein BGZ65_000731, partial [Modicella reniformis]
MFKSACSTVFHIPELSDAVASESPVSKSTAYGPTTSSLCSGTPSTTIFIRGEESLSLTTETSEVLSLVLNRTSHFHPASMMASSKLGSEEYLQSMVNTYEYSSSIGSSLSMQPVPQ